MTPLEFPVLLTSVLIPLLGAFVFPLLEGRLGKGGLAWLSFFLLIVPPATVVVLLLVVGLGEGIVDLPVYRHPLVGTFSMFLDWLGGLYILGIAVVTPLVALYSQGYMEHRISNLRDRGWSVPGLGTFYMLYTLFSASMSGVVLSGNLLLFYIFLKLSVMASFVLILLYGYGERYRISLMYLIWSSIAGLAFLWGILGLGAGVGTLDILNPETLELNRGLGEGLHLWIPLAIFIGLLIKKALFGFHIWLPYAHAEAPTPVSALLSPNLIGISGWAMIRIVYDMFPSQFATISPFFFVLSYVTMIYGGCMALAQDDLKRRLAYISVSQMGWVVLGFTTLTTDGIVGGVLLFVKHSLSLSILFMAAGLLISHFGGLRRISEMEGFWYRTRLTSALILVGFLILLGAPLTVGFWTKTLIFSGVMKMPVAQTTPGFLLMAGLLLFAGSLTGAYSLLTIKDIMFEGRERHAPKPLGWNRSTAPMAMIGVLGILLFFVPGPLIGPADLPQVSHMILEGGAFLAIYAVAYFLYQGRARELAVLLHKTIELQVIDRLFHEQLVSGIHRLSGGLRAIHSGVLNTYMFWMLSGFIAVTVFLLGMGM